MKRKLSPHDIGYRPSWIRRMWWWHGEWFIAAFGLAMVLAGCSISYLLAAHEAEAWQRFSIEHQCRVVGKMSGDVVIGTGVTANGQVTTTVGVTGDKTGYICNDGVIYWR